MFLAARTLALLIELEYGFYYWNWKFRNIGDWSSGDYIFVLFIRLIFSFLLQPLSQH